MLTKDGRHASQEYCAIDHYHLKQTVYQLPADSDLAAFSINSITLITTTGHIYNVYLIYRNNSITSQIFHKSHLTHEIYIRIFENEIDS